MLPVWPRTCWGIRASLGYVVGSTNSAWDNLSCSTFIWTAAFKTERTEKLMPVHLWFCFSAVFDISGTLPLGISSIEMATSSSIPTSLFICVVMKRHIKVRTRPRACHVCALVTRVLCSAASYCRKFISSGRCVLETWPMGTSLGNSLSLVPFLSPSLRLLSLFLLLSKFVPLL